MSRSRRKFVKELAGGIVGAAFVPPVLAKNLLVSPRRPYGPNDAIRIGAIGMGIMGFNNCQTATRIEGVELVAVCDLYDGRLERSMEMFGQDLFTTRHYEAILERDDIDAVIVSTSDHWHDHIAIAALEKGKAVYLEKPMVHHLEEGHAVIEAQKKSGKPLQVGSQRVSSVVTWKAREWYQDGAIGELVLVEAYYDRQSAIGAWQYSIPPDASPETVDWERFLGDAPKRPFDATRFFRWRNYQDYGTGVAGDLYVHLFSAIHTILDSKGPERIFATGGLRYWKDGRDVPDIILAVLDYPATDSHPAFNVQLRSNFIDGGGGGQRVKFVGTEGSIEVFGNRAVLKRSIMANHPGYGGWDSYFTFPEATRKAYEEWYNKTYPPEQRTERQTSEEEYRAPQGYSDHYEHHQNFFDAVRNGKAVFEDATFGLRAAGPSLAANRSYFNGAIVHWDPISMRVKE